MVRLYFVASVIGVFAILWVAHETGVLIIPFLARIFGRLAFVKSLMFRRGLTRAGTFMLLPLVPMVWRGRLRRWRRRWAARLSARLHALATWWTPLPLWRKAVLLGPVILAVAALLLLSLGLSGLTFLPVFGLRQIGRWFATGWLGRRILPFLGKTAGKLGLDRAALFLVGGLPPGWRHEVRRRSRHLARSMIRSRQRVNVLVRRVRPTRAAIAVAPPVPKHPA